MKHASQNTPPHSLSTHANAKFAVKMLTALTLTTGAFATGFAYNAAQEKNSDHTIGLSDVAREALLAFPLAFTITATLSPLAAPKKQTATPQR